MIRSGTFGTLAIIALAMAPLAVTTSAHAHGSMNPQHGGIVQEAGDTVVELVRGSDGVTLYLRMDDEPVPAETMQGKLTVSKGGTDVEKELAPANGNKLEAKGLKLSSGDKVGLTLTDTVTMSRNFTSFTIE
ncbi:hypothetical protein [Indioceanicola profundi]|uniref:hypothetical protein n=1 Tax=Indioceanicola profundi TaxID=2220096 RepID=UPI000E6AA3F6|nr:hypothetical protein [Indioceanicola profundi]